LVLQAAGKEKTPINRLHFVSVFDITFSLYNRFQKCARLNPWNMEHGAWNIEKMREVYSTIDLFAIPKH
jgi:hypothetical protein